MCVLSLLLLLLIETQIWPNFFVCSLFYVVYLLLDVASNVYT